MGEAVDGPLPVPAARRPGDRLCGAVPDLAPVVGPPHPLALHCGKHELARFQLVQPVLHQFGERDAAGRRDGNMVIGRRRPFGGNYLDFPSATGYGSGGIKRKRSLTDMRDPLLVTDLPVEYLFELRVDFDPAMLIYPTPVGTRIDAIASGGKAEGRRFNGSVLAGGGDWLTVPSDGVARMDVRATIQADSGDFVHYTSTGRIVLDADTRDRFLAGEIILGAEMYGRTAPLFETSSESYGWLNGTVAAGVVVELSVEHIRYQIFAIE
jgi:Protein of unknown function (DUF3237)